MGFHRRGEASVAGWHFKLHSLLGLHPVLYKEMLGHILDVQGQWIAGGKRAKSVKKWLGVPPQTEFVGG
jgi:hypothetical protein